MKNLEIINKKETFTVKENVNGIDIFYHYETDNNNTTPVVVNFSTQGKEKMLNGSYTQGGGFVLNGQGITEPTDLQIVEKAFTTILEIVKPKTEEIQELQEEQIPQAD